MGRRVDVDDLVDAQGVASLLGLAQRNSVYTYLRRYPDMPRPVIHFPNTHTRLWLRSEIIAWDKQAR
jgi:predicted DNA-binding transcriptional regulator AlpA